MPHSKQAHFNSPPQNLPFQQPNIMTKILAQHSQRPIWAQLTINLLSRIYPTTTMLCRDFFRHITTYSVFSVFIYIFVYILSRKIPTKNISCRNFSRQKQIIQLNSRQKVICRERSRQTKRLCRDSSRQKQIIQLNSRQKIICRERSRQTKRLCRDSSRQKRKLFPSSGKSLDETKTICRDFSRQHFFFTGFCRECVVSTEANTSGKVSTRNILSSKVPTTFNIVSRLFPTKTINVFIFFKLLVRGLRYKMRIVAILSRQVFPSYFKNIVSFSLMFKSNLCSKIFILEG